MNMSNNIPAHEVIVSGIHLELTPSLKTYVQEKTERLFRHEERIVRLRVELECDQGQTGQRRFIAKGHMQIYGPEMNAAVTADECHKAVALLVDKLDRMLRRRARLHKVKRHQLHAIDLDNVLLPKTA
jgi:putative sigma-54 modulation protein